MALGLSGEDRNRVARRLAPHLAVAAAYYVLARLGLLLAIIHPSASPAWPPAGLAIAAVLLLGPRIWPGLFVGAVLANLASGSELAALSIGIGNTLEALAGGLLIRRWAGGADAFETPLGVAKFAAICVFIAAPISATIGVGALSLAGLTGGSATFGAVWTTWWLGDLGGALVVTPVLVLWLRDARWLKALRVEDGAQAGRAAAAESSGAKPGDARPDDAKSGAARPRLAPALPVYGVAALVGLLAFSPLSGASTLSGPLGFLAIAPLLWAALRHGPREAATAALILAIFAVWGTLSGHGAFASRDLNAAFLVTLVFIVSASVPSLALSAAVAVRQRTEQALRAAREELDLRVAERTAALTEANRRLHETSTQREASSATQERQRLLLQEAQRLAHFGAWAWDVASGAVTWSPELHAIYGVKPGEFGGTPAAFLARLHPDDRPATEAAIAEALRTGAGFAREERIIRPDGALRHLQSRAEVIKDANGKIVQVVGVCQDVTEQQQAAAAAAESAQMLRRLIDGIEDYAIFLIDADGRIATWNSGAERNKGYRRDEIVGKHYRTFFTDEDRAAGLPDEALATAAREGKYEGEGWRLRKDGALFWASVVLDAIHDDAGKVVGYAKITRDITERREAQLALDRTREELAQAQKMESVGRLTGGVAHDFNNLLTVIIGNIQAIRRQAEGGDLDPARLLRHVDNALRGARRGAALTRRLLAVSRRAPLDPKPVSVRALIETMSDLLRSVLGESIELTTSVADDLWATHTDANQLETAILNLAVNARDAMPEGGTLTIAAGNLGGGGAPRPAELGEGDYVALVIRDTGTGIPPEILSQVFEPFFTTKDVGQGTGLGLAQVYGFARQSGGLATIESAAGRGTAVTLYLPRTTAAPAAAEAEDQIVDMLEGAGGKTVLLVEDDDAVRAYSLETLTGLGFTVIEAVRGQDALDILDCRPDIVLLFTDIGLPGGMNGRQLAREARQRRPDLKVLLTTAYAPDSPGAKSEPGMPLLTKPFTPAQLAKRIAALLTKSGHMPTLLVVEDEPLVRMVLVDDLKALGYHVADAGRAETALGKARTESIDAAIIDLGLPDRRGDVLLDELRALDPALPVLIASGDARAPESLKGDPRLRVIQKPYTIDQVEAALRALGIAPPDDEQP